MEADLHARINEWRQHVLEANAQSAVHHTCQHPSQYESKTTASCRLRKRRRCAAYFTTKPDIVMSSIPTVPEPRATRSTTRSPSKQQSSIPNRQRNAPPRANSTPIVSPRPLPALGNKPDLPYPSLRSTLISNDETNRNQSSELSSISRVAPTTYSDLTSASGIQSAISRHRSKSPTKKPSQLIDHEIRYRSDLRRAPDHVKPLISRLWDISNRGRQIFPSKLKAEILEHLEDAFDEDFKESAESEFVHDLEVHRDLVRIMEQAREHAEQSVGEGGWMDNVWRKMFDRVIENYNNSLIDETKSPQHTIEVMNVTAISMRSEFVLPNFDNRKVDYALMIPLDRDATITKRMKKGFESRNLPKLQHNVNHMPHDQSLYKQKLLAISVEAKTGQGTEDESQVQMALWEHGRMRHLTNLLEGSGGDGFIRSLPPMISINIYKHVWTCNFACVSEEDEFILYGPIQIGRTDQLDGIYKIYRAMLEIINYCITIYGPWVMQHCLGVINAHGDP